MQFNRRSALIGAASISVLPWAPSSAIAEGALLHLNPAKIAEWQKKTKQRKLRGSAGMIDYADENPLKGDKILLSFHGTSAPYQVSMPLSYQFLEAGYRVIMPNRPGYGDTDEDWGTGASGAARMAKVLLERTGISHPVTVIGTSAGGPAALAFASKYPASTKALILNSAVTHTWTEAKYVPLAGSLREKFRNLLEMKGLYRIVAEGVFLILGVPSVNFDTQVVGVGKNLEEAQKDIAYNAFKKMFVDADKKLSDKTKSGVENDYLDLYLADREFVRDWSRIKAPTLLTHCERDIVVPTEHAIFAREQILNSKLLIFDRVAGHITSIGPDAKPVHEAVIAFLKAHS